MNNRITSFEQYQSEYKKSIEHPEQFWAEKAEDFVYYSENLKYNKRNL